MNVITVRHSKSRAQAQIHPFGATVVAFQTSNGRDVLFISRLAKLDGTKAIRGGIPLVFPQFGQPDPAMPQHGFLRNNLWTVDESSRYDDDESAGINMVLPLSKAVNSRGGRWNLDTAYDCTVTLSVRVSPSSLVTTLTIANVGESMPFDFQALFHTYLKVEDALDPNTCNVTGLSGYECEDKITKETYKLNDEPIVIDTNVDRIYTPPTETKNLDVLVRTSAALPPVQVTANGMVDGRAVNVSAVVWNPHETKAREMSDFGDEQYVNMICVEPGLLTSNPPVKEQAVFTQVLTAT